MLRQNDGGGISTDAQEDLAHEAFLAAERNFSGHNEMETPIVVAYPTAVTAHVP